MKLLNPDKKGRLTQYLIMSNKKSSTAIHNEKKKVMNLFNALATDLKSFFNKRTNKKAKKLLYKKDIVFVNIYNGLENKNILPEKIPLNTPFVEKKRKHYLYNIIQFSQTFRGTIG